MLAFDHLVIAANHPSQDQIAFKENYRIKGFPGGRHEFWGTFNHLSHLQNDCYLEWIGVENEKTAGNSDNPLIQQLALALSCGRQGPIQFALRTTEMNQFIHIWDKQGIPYKGPFPGRREKTDGSTLKWRMLFPEAAGRNTLPFLIEWEGSNRPKDTRFINPQAFQEIKTGVSDLEQAVDLYNRVYGLGTPETLKEKSTPSYSWDLENGKLVLVQGEGIHAYLEGAKI
ncbi:VOC family protein [Thalassobacillus devorans]|uniref:VOC family protein n=1 Tax=Thalassobacillus devorans TaxID=279813 RepID=UPI0004B2491C|nr:VOC family protein [Thalassobacillus devorans]